jgi:hypothetical protein
LITALNRVINAVQLRAGGYVCGIEKRDSMSYDEIEILVFGYCVDSDERNEMLLEMVVEHLALNSSGIETRRFGQTQLFVSKDIQQPFMCAVKSSVKSSFLIVVGLAVAVTALWAREKTGVQWWWDWQMIVNWFAGPSADDGPEFQ